MASPPSGKGDALGPVAVGVAVVAVLCCAGLPLVAGLIGSLTLAGVLGASFGMLALGGALGAVWIVVRARRRRADAADLRASERGRR